MNLVANLFNWTNSVVWIGLVVVWLWAFIDCAARKSATFPAANRLTKPAWLAITGFSALIGILVQPYTGTPGIIALIAVTASSVYLADVRPAVREISGGGW